MISEGRRIPELDGLRGLAAIVVVIAHYFGEVPNGVPLWIGWMGVTLFFVLSGFLIGSIILERRDSPNFFIAFYVRRVFRILPVYVLTTTLVLAFFYAYGPTEWMNPPLPAAAYFSFTQNFVMAAKSYYGLDWLVPTWTLAVEEQFYFIAPLFMVLMPRRYTLWAITGGMICALLIRTAFYLMNHEIAGQVLFLSRADLLLFGVLIAYLHNRNIIIPEGILRAVRLICAGGVVALSVQAKSVSDALPVDSILNPLLTAGAFASYILSTTQGSDVLKAFRRPIWVWLGSVSYCLYLTHQPINGMLHGLIFDSQPDIENTWRAAVTLAALAVSIGLARWSLIYIERPLLKTGRSLAIYAPEQVDHSSAAYERR